MIPNKIVFENVQLEHPSIENLEGYKLIFTDDSSEVIEFREEVSNSLLSRELNVKIEFVDESNQIFVLMLPNKFSANSCVTIDSMDEERLFTTSENIDIYDLVSIETNGFTVVKTNLELIQSRKYLGVALESSNIGNPVTVKITGVIYDPSWDWDLDKELWCGEDGKLTQVPINEFGKVSLKVGEVLTKNIILITRFEPILL